MIRKILNLYGYIYIFNNIYLELWYLKKYEKIIVHIRYKSFSNRIYIVILYA